MKKYSKLALILAMLIGVSSTMAACKPNNNEGDEKANYLELEEKANNAIYKKRIDEWLKYVEYGKEKFADKNANSSAFTQKDTDTIDSDVNIKDSIYETVETTKQYIKVENVVAPPAGEGIEKGEEGPQDPGAVNYEEKLSEVDKKITLRLKDSDKEVVTLTQKTFIVEGDKLVDNTKTKDYQVEYKIDYLGLLVRVEKTNYKLKDAIPSDVPGEPPIAFDATLVSSYEAVKTYTYYNAKTGEVFLENLSVEENQTINFRGNLVDALDKTYLFVNGEVAREFVLNMEYELPIFSKDNQQTSIGNYDEYVYFEQGEYGYRIDETSPLVGQQIGDLTMVLFPGLSVRVYKDYEMVAMYETEAYHIAGYAVLPNGNVYICEYKLLDDDATNYDFKIEDFKLKVVHSVLDVTTGIITEKDNKFVATKLYSNVTDQIETTLNKNTVLLDPTTSIEGMTVKDGYILAEVQNYKNGILEGNTEFVVLNAETLEKVASLPKIVPGQFGYLGFVSENEMLLNTRTVDNKIIRYTANTVDGDLELFTKGNVITLANDAFVYDNKIYDYDWEEIEFTYDSPYSTFASYVNYMGQPTYLPNGKFIFKEVESSYGTTTTKFFLGEVVEARIGTEYKDGQESAMTAKRVSVKEFLSISGGTNYSITHNGVCYELRQNSAIVNFFNLTSTVSGGYVFISLNYILNLDSEQKTINSTSDNTYAYYLATKAVTSSTMLSDGTMLVCVTETWNLSYSNTNDSSAEVLKYAGKTYNQYYIIK